MAIVAFYTCDFQVNGEPIAQTFELAGKAMRVGGVRWTVKCPESGKMVRDLYLLLRPTTRISVRAMPWACPTVRTGRKNVMGNVPRSLWIGLARRSGVSRRYVRKTCSGGRLKG